MAVECSERVVRAKCKVSMCHRTGKCKSQNRLEPEYSNLQKAKSTKIQNDSVITHCLHYTERSRTPQLGKVIASENCLPKRNPMSKQPVIEQFWSGAGTLLQLMSRR
jgi:hypothetical protein